MEFTPFPKVPRLMRNISISEKIDGTNASIWIGEDDTLRGVVDPTIVHQWDGYDTTYIMRCASRKRWIHPGKGSDNAGFAAWVSEHAEELTLLGQGHHFGEWWGAGIQRNYGMAYKKFSLFNPQWLEEEAPSCVDVVPQLYEGVFDMAAIELELSDLGIRGSVAAPGFMKPEGIMVYHQHAHSLFKVTLDGDGHKGVIE